MPRADTGCMSLYRCYEKSRRGMLSIEYGWHLRFVRRDMAGMPRGHWRFARPDMRCMRFVRERKFPPPRSHHRRLFQSCEKSLRGMFHTECCCRLEIVRRDMPHMKHYHWRLHHRDMQHMQFVRRRRFHRPGTARMSCLPYFQKSLRHMSGIACFRSLKLARPDRKSMSFVPERIFHHPDRHRMSCLRRYENSRRDISYIACC